jgi:hypothetical protein
VVGKSKKMQPTKMDLGVGFEIQKILKVQLGKIGVMVHGNTITHFRSK